MSRYLAQRVALIVPTILGGMLVLFVTFRVLPGDPVLMMMSGGEGGSVNPQAYASLRSQLHLDQPVYQQFLIWLSDLARGDLGTSYQTGHATTTEIGLRLPTSLTLMLLAMTITVVLAIPMGTLAAVRRNSFIDYLLRVLSLAGLSMPSFWVGILLVLLLITVWHWYPPTTYTVPYQNPWVALQQLAFPALVLGFRPVGVAVRVLRSSLLDELSSDYARTARAKGAPAAQVVGGHVLPNSLLPTLTIFGLELAALFGGSVVVESIFNVPGVGQLLIQALQRRDLPLIEGILLLVLVFVAFVNLAVDLMYAQLDPRVRL